MDTEAQQAQMIVSSRQYITFMLAGEEYAVDILAVQELRGWEKTTPVAGAPSYVIGMINLRGTVVPIIDLRTRFGLPSSAYGSTTVVIIIRLQNQVENSVIGMVVDAMSEVHDIRSHEIQPSPDIHGTVSDKFVAGVATVEQKMITLLDIQRLVRHDAFTNGDSTMNMKIAESASV